MNERQRRVVYLIGMAGSAYAFWYFYSSGANLPAAVFALATVFFVVRLRPSSSDT